MVQPLLAQDNRLIIYGAINKLDFLFRSKNEELVFHFDNKTTLSPYDESKINITMQIYASTRRVTCSTYNKTTLSPYDEKRRMVSHSI